MTSSNLVALAAKYAHPGTDLKLAPGALIWTRPDPTSSGQAHLVLVWPDILNANGMRYDLTVGPVV